VREAALLVIEKLGKDGCRASRLAGPWLDARADKTLGDWLRIVSTNVVRDYLRDRQGRARASAGVDKRVLYSLATLLPCDDDLPPAEMLSATSRHAATELAEWAAKQLPPEQTRALAAWLAGSDFDEIAASQSAGDGAEAKRLVRAAVATLRRYALAA
jgi:DNA-directed RNA polymerase specialized sigma24 family protein